MRCVIAICYSVVAFTEVAAVPSVQSGQGCKLRELVVSGCIHIELITDVLSNRVGRVICSYVVESHQN